MIGFLKNLLIKGVLILIPIVVLYITLRELLELMVAMATPIADLFPEGTFDHEKETEIIAILLILGTAILLGLLASAKPIRSLGAWVEDRTLNRLPMYRMLSSFVAAFLGMEEEETFKPALLTNDGGTREPVYVIEDPGYDQVVVMQPWTPTPFAGSLKLVPKSKVEILPVTLDEFSLSLTHFGLGLAGLVARHSTISSEDTHQPDD
jgi:uncharacterized membrane protein